MARKPGIPLLAALLLALGVAVPAAAQSTDPALTVDARFAPPDGVARDDLAATDIPAGVASFGDRIYTVGEVRDTTGDSNVGIVARLSNGVFDTSFSEDGKLSLPIAAPGGKDVATDIAVTSDGRLRILASTDTDPGAAANIATAVVGLNADGTPDTTFGTGGVTTFKAGPGTAEETKARNDTPTRLAIGPDGRIAVTGAIANGTGKEDSFVALLETGTGNLVPGFGTGGVKVLDRGGAALNDRGVDVAFRPGGGILAFLRVETNQADSVNDFQAILHGFDDSGADDPRFNGTGDLQLAVGDPDTVAGGMLVVGDRVFLGGATKAGLDTNAFLARINADGSGLESRQFDMRGDSILDDELVTSSVSDLAVVPGPPVTVVAAGSVNYSSRPYWAAAAFQGVDGPIASTTLGDAIVPTAEYGALVGVTALADGSLAAAGSLVDTQSNFDTSFGTTRLLVDAKKRCDLKLEVSRPLELAFPAGTSAPVTLKVANVGDRPCPGRVSVPSPFALTGDAAVPTLNPGASFSTTGVSIADQGARRVDDVAVFGVAGQRDADLSNNTAPVRVRFEYCDLALRAVTRSPRAPSVGYRTYELSVRNGGTKPCTKSGVDVLSGGKRVGGLDRFTLPRGRSASVDVRVRLSKGRKVGSSATLAFKSVAASDPSPDNDRAGVKVRVVATGDTRIRATGKRLLRGTATGGSGGKKASKATRKALRLRRVEVAVTRPGKRCATVTGVSGKLRTSRSKRCGARVWIAATGAAKWRVKLRKGLPKGRWVVTSRALVRDGDLPESSFSKKDRNTTTFRVR